jgi:hypothetical protein
MDYTKMSIDQVIDACHQAKMKTHGPQAWDARKIPHIRERITEAVEALRTGVIKVEPLKIVKNVQFRQHQIGPYTKRGYRVVQEFKVQVSRPMEFHTVKGGIAKGTTGLITRLDRTNRTMVNFEPTIGMHHFMDSSVMGTLGWSGRDWLNSEALGIMAESALPNIRIMEDAIFRAIDESEKVAEEFLEKTLIRRQKLTTPAKVVDRLAKALARDPEVGNIEPHELLAILRVGAMNVEILHHLASYIQGHTFDELHWDEDLMVKALGVSAVYQIDKM